MKSIVLITATIVLIAATVGASARIIKSSEKPYNNNQGGRFAPGGDGFNLPGWEKEEGGSRIQELQDYWQVRTNKSLPPVFLSKLSTTVIIGTRTQLLNHTINYHPHPLSYNLSVGGDTNASASAEAKRAHEASTLHSPHHAHPQSYDLYVTDTNASASAETKIAGDAPSLHSPHHAHPQSYDLYVTRRSGFNSIWSGLFFRESLLKEGTTVPLLKFANVGSNRFFLPRSIASNIPFSLGAVSAIFNISSGSTVYRAVKSIIDDCTALPNIGESTRCVTSAEDMIDYTLSTLGADTDIKCWSTHNWSGFGGRSSVIGKLSVVYDGKFTDNQQLSCHRLPFPYLLYDCHTVSGTVFYNMEILDAKRKVKINEAVAVCHMNTSAWDPHHVAFAVMGTAPGKTEVCHWVVPWDMAFTS